MRLATSLFLFICIAAHAVIIPAERRIDWSTAGVIGGIPTNQAKFTNFTSSVSLASLNAAITACPSNQYVFLTNGSYTFAGTIDFGQKDGVVLRGNGPDKTFITFNAHGGGSNIHIGEETINRVDPPAGQIRDWTNGFTQGATVITLSGSMTGFPADGHLLALDQLNDNIWVNENTTPLEGCTYCGRENGDRAQAQYVRIVSRSGNAVTISPGLHMMNYRTNMLPQVFWWTDDDTKMCGVESMTITNNVGSGLFAIYISQAQNCWVKDVVIQKTSQAAIETSQVKNIEIRRCSFLSEQTAGSQSYGMVWLMSSDGLMIDCISDSITGTMNYAQQAEGNVVAYNFITNNVYTPSNWDIAGLAGHDGHVCMNLSEGNWANKIYYDSIHGSESHNTDLRNYYHGHQDARDNNTMAYTAEQFCRSNNLVGCILGTVGYHTDYIIDNPNEGGGDESVIVLGIFGSSSTTPYDTNVVDSIIIHGNWDAVNNAQTYNSGIADHAIPNSYYLASKPSWFGAFTWPPFDPAAPTLHSPTNLPAGRRWLNYQLSGNQADLVADAPAAPSGTAVTNLLISGNGFKITGQGFKIH